MHFELQFSASVMLATMTARAARMLPCTFGPVTYPLPAGPAQLVLDHIDLGDPHFVPPLWVPERVLEPVRATVPA